MRTSNSVACLTLLILVFAGPIHAQRNTTPKNSYETLHQLPLASVPEKARVTDLFTTHGNAAADGFVLRHGD